MSIKQNKREYIAFEGKKFTIEWYFDEKGKSISLDYLESLAEKEQAKLFELIKLMGNRGKIKTRQNLEVKVKRFTLLSHSPIGSYASSLRVVKLL